MTTTVGAGKFLRLVRDGRWEFVERVNARGVVAVVAVTRDLQLILTEQYRPAVGRAVIDLPAGLAGDVKGQEVEELTASARRELVEETGYDSRRLKHLADCPTSPGLTSEVVSLFLARNVRAVGDGGGVEGESITVHSVPLAGIERWLSRQARRGVAIDMKVYAGLHFALSLPALRRKPSSE